MRYSSITRLKIQTQIETEELMTKNSPYGYPHKIMCLIQYVSDSSCLLVHRI